MELKLANEIARNLTDLKLAEDRLAKFKNTKEFCDIRITGEDGTENSYMFNIGWKTRPREVKEIRDKIESLLVEHINYLEGVISDL